MFIHFPVVLRSLLTHSFLSRRDGKYFLGRLSSHWATTLISLINYMSTSLVREAGRWLPQKMWFLLSFVYNLVDNYFCPSHSQLQMICNRFLNLNIRNGEYVCLCVCPQTFPPLTHIRLNQRATKSVWKVNDLPEVVAPARSVYFNEAPRSGKVNPPPSFPNTQTESQTSR